MPRHAELLSATAILEGFMMKDTGVGRSEVDYSAVVNGILPVRHTFEINVIPAGDVAPLDIRKQWVGLRLPVRTLIMPEEPAVHVLAVDGINALARAGHEEAHQWWRDFYDKSPYGLMPGILNPFAARHQAMAARISFLGFNSVEGVLSDVPNSRKRFWQSSKTQP